MANPSRPVRLTTGGITYSIIEGYPKMDIEDLGTTKVTEKYLIRSGNALAFYLESFPPPSISGSVLDLPARRRMPNAPWLVTRSLHPLENSSR